MNFTNMNIKDFIDYIITFDNVDDILDECKTQSDKGFVYERLFDIVIKFGFCDVFTKSIFYHLIGNSNNAKLKVLKYLNQYLNEKVLSGNSSGCSDITLQNKNDDTYIFISSKYPKSSEDIKKQKAVDYYDKVKTANESSEYITEYINEEKYLSIKEKLFLRFHQELNTQKKATLYVKVINLSYMVVNIKVVLLINNMILKKIKYSYCYTSSNRNSAIIHK